MVKGDFNKSEVRSESMTSTSGLAAILQRIWRRFSLNQSTPSLPSQREIRDVIEKLCNVLPGYGTELK